MKYMKLTKAVAVGSMMAAGVAGTTVPSDAQAGLFSKGGTTGTKCTKTWWGGTKCTKTSTSTSTSTSTTSGGSTTSTTSGGSTTSGSTTTTSTTSGSSSGGTPVPEPSSMVLFGIGAAGVVAGRKIARKKAKKNA